MLNNYDEKYEIRIANKEDIPEIMEFIDTYWKKGHILATNREFFEYEHCINDTVTYIIARNRTNGNIEAIHGYLPSNSSDNPDVWGVVWKVRNEKENMPFLGIELKKRVFSLLNARTDLGVGANPNTSVPILKILLKYCTGKMKHYYRLSTGTDFKVAVINEKKYVKKDDTIPEITVKEIKSTEELKKEFNFELYKESVPYKDSWYIEKRYFNHPVFEYKINCLYDGNNIAKALLITRVQQCNGVKILRIVDYIGDIQAFSGLYDYFEKELENYEYIDFYFFGADENIVKKAGFVERTDNDINIIPNYFSPFVQKNIDIWVDSSCSDCTFFKADGDQDRPN